MQIEITEQRRIDMNRVIITIIGLFLFCQGAWGATIVAKPDAANPSSAIMYRAGTLANCGDQDASFSTTKSQLSKASTAAGAGGTLSVCPGTYKGTMLSATNGSLVLSYANQELKGAGAASTILDGSNTVSNVLDNMASSGSLTISGLTIQNAPASGFGFNGRSYGVNITDTVFQNNAVPFYFIGSATRNLTRVTARNNTATYYAGGGLLGGTLNCRYCIWENNSSQFRAEGATSIANIYNSLMIGNKIGAITINTPGAIANIYNSIAVANVTDNSGTHPFIVVGGATLNVSNSIILPCGTRPETNFYSSANESNDLHLIPGFVSPRRFGWISLFVDDTAGWSYFKTVADYANARGVGMVYAAENTRSMAPSMFAGLAAYVAKGNEVAAHVREVHLDLTQMNAVTITGKSGSTPTVTVSIDQSADRSSIWSGNVLLKENGSAVKTIPVSASTTLNDLAASINSLSGWIASVNAGSVKGAYERPITLANVVDQPVATSWVAQFDQQKFWHYQIAETKAELEAGIGNGYVVQTFVYPGDGANETLRTWISTDANFTKAGTTAFKIARGGPNSSGSPGTYTLSDDVLDAYHPDTNGFRIMNLFEFDASAGLRPNQSRDLAAISALLTHIGGYVSVLSHSANDYSVAQWQALIDTMIATPGMSIVLPRDAASTIRTSGLWSDVNGDGMTWARHFTDAQDYHLMSGSPAINAGLNSIWSGTVSVSDFAGTPVTNSSGAIVAPGGAVDIGVYEDVTQPSGSIVINGGAGYTDSPSVTLTLSASDPNGISQMCISNTTECTVWENFAASKVWVLSNGSVIFPVYAWYKNNQGTIDQFPYTASIIYDLTPLSAVTPPSPVGQSSYTLTGFMQAGSTVTITSGSGATIEPVIYTSPNSWNCAVSSLAPGDTAFSISATTPFGQVASTTVTVNYATGSITAVPAMNAPVMVALAAAMMQILRYANGRGARQTGEC
jgi:hypothetical protein